MKTSLSGILGNLLAAATALMLGSCATQHTKGTGSSTTPSPAAVELAQPAPATPSAHSTPANAPATPETAKPGQVTLTVVKVDSEETAGEDGKGANAVDGNPSTFWHTQWQDANPEHPHEIIIELHPPCTIKGFTYLPRQDDSENGMIKDYEFYVSNDGQDFGQPVNKGSFDDGKDLHTVIFEPVKCRFIKLKALSEINGEAWTSAAEIGVVPSN